MSHPELFDSSTDYNLPPLSPEQREATKATTSLASQIREHGDQYDLIDSKPETLRRLMAKSVITSSIIASPALGEARVVGAAIAITSGVGVARSVVRLDKFARRRKARANRMTAQREEITATTGQEIDLVRHNTTKAISLVWRGAHAQDEGEYRQPLKKDVTTVIALAKAAGACEVILPEPLASQSRATTLGEPQELPDWFAKAKANDKASKDVPHDKMVAVPAKLFDDWATIAESAPAGQDVNTYIAKIKARSPRHPVVTAAAHNNPGVLRQALRTELERHLHEASRTRDPDIFSNVRQKVHLAGHLRGKHIEWQQSGRDKESQLLENYHRATRQQLEEILAHPSHDRAAIEAACRLAYLSLIDGESNGEQEKPYTQKIWPSIVEYAEAKGYNRRTLRHVGKAAIIFAAAMTIGSMAGKAGAVDPVLDNPVSHTIDRVASAFASDVKLPVSSGNLSELLPGDPYSSSYGREGPNKPFWKVTELGGMSANGFWLQNISYNFSPQLNDWDTVPPYGQQSTYDLPFSSGSQGKQLLVERPFDVSHGPAYTEFPIRIPVLDNTKVTAGYARYAVNDKATIEQLKLAVYADGTQALVYTGKPPADKLTLAYTLEPLATGETGIRPAPTKGTGIIGINSARRPVNSTVVNREWQRAKGFAPTHTNLSHLWLYEPRPPEATQKFNNERDYARAVLRSHIANCATLNTLHILMYPDTHAYAQGFNNQDRRGEARTRVRYLSRRELHGKAIDKNGISEDHTPTTILDAEEYAHYTQEGFKNTDQDPERLKLRKEIEFDRKVDRVIARTHKGSLWVALLAGSALGAHFGRDYYTQTIRPRYRRRRIDRLAGEDLAQAVRAIGAMRYALPGQFVRQKHDIPSLTADAAINKIRKSIPQTVTYDAAKNEICRSIVNVAYWSQPNIRRAMHRLLRYTQPPEPSKTLLTIKKLRSKMSTKK